MGLNRWRLWCINLDPLSLDLRGRSDVTTSGGLLLLVVVLQSSKSSWTRLPSPSSSSFFFCLCSVWRRRSVSLLLTRRSEEKALIKTAALNSAAAHTWLHIFCKHLAFAWEVFKNWNPQQREQGGGSTLAGIRMYTSTSKQTEKPTVAPFAKKKKEAAIFKLCMKQRAFWEISAVPRENRRLRRSPLHPVLQYQRAI